ncbi:hypothetical protein TRVL_03669 [Trypanosoma vivax]|nr:hypothetical protein TRVL_03669 [Trypanosoma vivax]
MHRTSAKQRPAAFAPLLCRASFLGSANLPHQTHQFVSVPVSARHRTSADPVSPSLCTGAVHSRCPLSFSQTRALGPFPQLHSRRNVSAASRCVVGRLLPSLRGLLPTHASHPHLSRCLLPNSQSRARCLHRPPVLLRIGHIHRFPRKRAAALQNVTRVSCKNLRGVLLSPRLRFVASAPPNALRPSFASRCSSCSVTCVSFFPAFRFTCCRLCLVTPRRCPPWLALARRPASKAILHRGARLYLVPLRTRCACPFSPARLVTLRRTSLNSCWASNGLTLLVGLSF